MSKVSKYLCCFKMSVGQSFEYRADFFLNILATFIPICVQLFLWKAIYANSASDVINGRTYPEMITYLVFAFFVTYFLTCSVANSVAADIKDGALNQYLIRPVNYFGYRVANFYGSKACMTVIVAVLFIAAIGLMHGIFDYRISGINLLWFLPLMLLSLLMQFFLYLCMGLSSFWITDAWGVFFGGRYIINILSGGLLPLDVLGSSVNQILQWLPFQYTTYFPISILQGRLEPEQILRGIGIEFFWILLLFLLCRVMWKKGQTKYMGNGG